MLTGVTILRRRCVGFFHQLEISTAKLHCTWGCKDGGGSVRESTQIQETLTGALKASL